MADISAAYGGTDEDRNGLNPEKVKRYQKMSSLDLGDSGFISPPTKTLTTLRDNSTSDSSVHSSDDFTTPYNLRASSRCGSSPFPLPCLTPSLGGVSKSSPNLPSATSTPAHVSNEQFQKRLEESSYSSDGSSGHDSGIESLIVSPRNSTGNLFESSVKSGPFPVDSARLSPISQSSSSSLGAVPKRRSPRQTGHKVDGIERLSRILKGRSGQQRSAKDCDYGATVQFILPSIEKFEEKKDRQVLALRADPCRQGRETVDVLRHLYEKDLVFILDKIYSYLAPCDLCNLAMVSQLWNLGLQCRKDQDGRRKEFAKLKRLDRENWGKQNVIRSSPRRAMADLANVNRLSPSSKRDRNPSSNALLSPSKIRHRLFVEEAAKLSPGERLVHCPLCTSPCRVTSGGTPPITRASATPPSSTQTNMSTKSVQVVTEASPCSQLVNKSTPCIPLDGKDFPLASKSTPSLTNQAICSSRSTPSLTSQAICSSAKCRFIFCPECHCEDHPGRPCRVTRSGSKVPKAGTVTSKKSKARLRRL